VNLRPIRCDNHGNCISLGDDLFQRQDRRIREQGFHPAVIIRGAIHPKRCFAAEGRNARSLEDTSLEPRPGQWQASKPRPDSNGKRLCQKIGKTEKYEDKHLLAG
jgi:hypothetical protein